MPAAISIVTLGVSDLAVRSGGKLIKAPEPVYWGGYSGYFADPDGHLWEVACGSVEYAREQHEADT